ncbi:MAG: hypothetical protein ACRDNY_05835 [Gaiellaceae bacterium]
MTATRSRTSRKRDFLTEEAAAAIARRNALISELKSANRRKKTA